MTFEIPEPLKAEHEELHAALVKATRAGGRTGEAARRVAELLHPHFVREEEFVTGQTVTKERSTEFDRIRDEARTTQEERTRQTSEWRITFTCR